jgi:hypothetical protein
VLHAAKVVKSTMQTVRHRTAVTMYRTLYVVGLWRGPLPDDTGSDDSQR